MMTVSRNEHGAEHGGVTRSFTARIVLLFGLVAVMTALIAALVLAIVWENHFNEYAKQNMQRTADFVAQSVADRYERAGNWEDALAGMSEVSIDDTVTIEIRSSNGTIVYSENLEPLSTDALSTILDSSQVISVPVVVNGEQVGTVNVWTGASGGFITGRDNEFRSASYGAVVFAALVAVVISCLIGHVLSRGLVNPIRKITRAADAMKDGDLSARTGLVGNDEIAQLCMTFDDMADSIENDRKLERRLINDVAHELRTPLMAMQATVEAMVDGVLPADEQHLDMVNNEVVRLGKLVDALLKLSRLENRSTPLNAQELDLGKLIEELVLNHQMLVEESGLELRYTYEPGIMVSADPDLMKQATANILSNAVRYTPEGGSISIDVHRGNLMAQISVRDTGIGMSEEDLKHIFSRFWRSDTARDSESGGLGVGLAIVKEIVDRHNGWVNVESSLGEGSVFTINIPLLREDPAKAKRTKGKSTGRTRHFLIFPAKTDSNDAEAKAQAKREKAAATAARKAEKVTAKVQGGLWSALKWGNVRKTGLQVITQDSGDAGEAGGDAEPEITHNVAYVIGNEGEEMQDSTQAMDIRPDSSGKVRDIYDLGDSLLMVASDRISAFDYILEDEIPHKGEVLNRISLFWFDLLADVVGNHVISADMADLPERFKPYEGYLAGRSMIVRKAEMFPVECIVRGYLAGSGLKEYQVSSTVCSIELPEGLVNSSKLPEPIFTPSTKAEIGDHDENVSFDAIVNKIGRESAEALRDLSIEIYCRAADYALDKGIIIADTKLEFGVVDGRIILADEVLTPDSSRFWPRDLYEEGKSQPSFDKQFIRDWLDANWDRTGNPPRLPGDIIAKTSEKYIQAFEMLTGEAFEPQGR